MLDINNLRKDLAGVIARLEARKSPQMFLNVDVFTALEAERKAIQIRTEELQAKRNALSKQIGQLKAKGAAGQAEADAVMAQVGEHKVELESSAARLEVIQSELQTLLLALPNLPHESVPVGKDESGNVEVKKWSKTAVAGVNTASVAIENVAIDVATPLSVTDSGEKISPVELAEAQEVADVEADAQAEVQAEKTSDAIADTTADAAPAEAIEPPKPVVAPKKVIAARGDDRPGTKKAEALPAGKFGAGRFGDRKPDGRAERGERGDSRGSRDQRPDARGDRFNDRPAFEDRGPRLGDAAFRAQRDALEAAQFALKKLAAAAHGEVLVQLLDAWQTRDAAKVPSAQDLGKQLPPTARSAWTAAITAAPAAKSADADTALLRLEMAAELPTPADHLAARRMLQLQLLTKRNDPAPAQTWTADAAKVFANGFDDGAARRVQNALKVLLKR